MCYKGNYNKKQRCESEQIFKNYPGSDCSLKPENMKEELLVIVNDNVTVNVYPDLVHTARHATEVRSSA